MFARLLTFCFGISFLLGGAGPLFAFAWETETPTFVIKEAEFFARQTHDYRLGDFAEKPSLDEIRRRIEARQYTYTDTYKMSPGLHFYFFYIIDNQSGASREAILHYPLLLDSDGWLYHAGSFTALKQVSGTEENFRVTIPEGRSIIVGRRVSDGLFQGATAGVFLTNSDDYLARNFLFWNLTAAVFGAVLIMALYNLGLFFFFRKKYFLHYCLYCFGIISMSAMLFGYIPLSTIWYSFFNALVWISIVLFFNSSLGLRRHAPNLYRIAMWSIALLSVIITYTVVSRDWTFLLIQMPFFLVFGVICSVVRYRQGFKPGIYFIVGWACVAMGVGFAVFEFFANVWVPLQKSILIGFALEVCFFSFAIGQKLRLSEQKTNEQNQHAFNQLKKVFYPHQIQQIKLGVELEQTMPTGNQEACVLSFDIAKSSSIKSHNAKAFLQDTIKACVQILSRDYDPVQLSATGYRIKEMGDGFLCSIGYPFRVPGQAKPEIFSYELALKLIQLFQQKVEEHLPDEQIYCSIGLAYGHIEAYFPLTGTIEYDVYGRSVVPATRYEAMRKQLFPQGLHGHIITMQERIYNHLPLHQQKELIAVDLRHVPMAVRDDKDARRIYYRLISPSTLAEPIAKTPDL